MVLLFSLLMAASADAQPVVEVFLPPFNDRNLTRALGRARGVVEQAYADIGVRVAWRVTAALPSDCSRSPMRRQIVFDLRTDVGTGRHPAALAYANPYSQQGPCVTILVNRLKDLADRNPETTGILMGHVLAHEIGHVLQGVARHSESGLMKERWSQGEIQDMWRQRMSFTPYDAQSILEPFEVTPDPAQKPLRSMPR